MYNPTIRNRAGIPCNTEEKVDKWIVKIIQPFLLIFIIEFYLLFYVASLQLIAKKNFSVKMPTIENCL